MGANAAMLLTGAQSLNTAIAQRQQAGAVLASGQYNQNLANWNAKLADQQAQDALARGQVAERRQNMATSQTIGAQRAALAASGVDVNSGSAVDTQANTASLGALDALMIRTNAQREAWGYHVQAANDRQQGILAGLEARNQADAYKAASWSTLLTGAANIYGMTQPDGGYKPKVGKGKG